MKLVALDIPDDPAERPAWLERHLVGLDLAALVAELEAVHGRPGRPDPPLAEVLADRREAVLADGLAALPPRALGRLLRHPRLLPELQELVLVSGGDHWARVGPGDADQFARVRRGRERLSAWLKAEGKRSAREPIARPKPPTVAWHRRPAVVALATAASLLVAVVAFEMARPPTPAAWGWDRPGALAGDLSRSAYLARLADEAGEWFDDRPDDRLALARRIVEFRRGCSALSLADHRPLPADDRAWLVAKCRDWASKLDAHLAAVEAGRDAEAVRAEADETARKLIAALRERAATGA